MAAPRTGNRDVDLALKAIIDRLDKVESSIPKAVMVGRDEHRVEVKSSDGRASVRVQVDDGSNTEALTRDIDGRGRNIKNVKTIEVGELRSSKGSLYLGNDTHIFADGKRVFISSTAGLHEIVLTKKRYGTTSERPDTAELGDPAYFDTSKGFPVWFDGSDWVDATGTVSA